MKVLFAVGLIVLIIGVGLLFVPIPHKQTHGFQAGKVKVGFQTETSEKVSPIVSATLILAGAAMMVAGRRRR